ncbi:hypothetical protein BCR36DRAFT_365693 [Piromyces finnis]|uniref:Uncharacterized protein n=1 Tax=Piromyces finnis TaxID=1754191 RepID=A0A1Y1VNX3_9FUNG|nr:hypothetical protein BCR36DRAFT_365693 [Piromyces finnis]|eukprot:ORX61107.1 hypothetical protein BCR36DRAFT_365693 [Piromyces finnis]
MANTRAINTMQFPFHYAEYKMLFDNNHPRCPIWKKYFDETSKFRCFISGAPLNPMVKKWFKDTLNINSISCFGSSEGRLILYENHTDPLLPGEEGYFCRIPWIDFLLKPLNDDDPNIGELYTHSDVSVLGYFGRAKPGEFYDSPVPGMRCDIGTANESNEFNESNENGGNGRNEIVENKNILNKTNENFSNKIQAN